MGWHGCIILLLLAIVEPHDAETGLVDIESSNNGAFVVAAFLQSDADTPVFLSCGAGEMAEVMTVTCFLTYTNSTVSRTATPIHIPTMTAGCSPPSSSSGAVVVIRLSSTSFIPV